MARSAEELLRLGVAGICGVDTAEFNAKHWGAAVVAAGLLAADPDMGEAAPAIIAQAERLMAAKAAWLPPPHSRASSASGDTTEVVMVLRSTASSLNLLGHDTIFASVALRAMTLQPELASRANIEGLVAMIEFASSRGPGGPFPGWDDPGQVRVDEDDAIPEIDSVAQLAASAIEAFAAVGVVHEGRDQGVVQHMVTHAHALVDLDGMGHGDVFAVGVEAHRRYRKLLTKRPLHGDDALPLHAPIPVFESAEYWRQDLRGSSDWIFGHVFKVALAWRGLEPLLADDIREAALPMLATTMAVT